MKKLLVIFSFLLIFQNFNAQEKLNLDFETLENDLAKDWSVFGNGNHKILYDQTISQSGKISGSIESIDNKEDFKALAYSIPADFGGKRIKLTGYVKTENVIGGWAGLWMRIDPQIAFDNMNSRGITGTTDWKKYEIELELSSDAKTVVVGGLLIGSGKIWIDNLSITIDGKPLNKAPEKVFTHAQKDTEFDNGSKIQFSKLDDTAIDNLELLGKIWGFLKYYHPEIGKGNYNWDYELFRILPSYSEVSTTSQRDEILLKWIDNLGELKICKSCQEIGKNTVLKPDMAWMKSTDISQDLKEKLKFIEQNRFQGTHYYVEFEFGVKNPKFKNENAYENMPYPDEGFRLLTLFKYWNIIQYYSPYKHLTDKKWDATLKEYIPTFINAKNELEFELAALQIIGDAKDTHANLWGGNNAIEDDRGAYYPPVHVRFIEDQLIVTDYYNREMESKVGLKIGDIISKINGVSMEELIKEKLPFYPGSNYPTQLRDIALDLMRSNNKKLDLQYIRDVEELPMVLPLFEKKDLNYYSYNRPKLGQKCFRILDGNIGYINLENIKEEDIPNIKAELKDTKGIIVDIRNYPATFVVFSLGNFLNSNRADFVKFTKGSEDYPGVFTYTDPLKIGIDRSGSYKGNKVIVLVNEISQSQAEYTAMAFRAGDKTTIVGSTTAGADGNISYINLPGGLLTVISGIGVYYPDGTETQRVGIVPDVEVLPTIQGIIDGKDEPLEKAIEIINQL